MRESLYLQRSPRRVVLTPPPLVGHATYESERPNLSEARAGCDNRIGSRTPPRPTARCTATTSGNLATRGYTPGLGARAARQSILAWERQAQPVTSEVRMLKGVHRHSSPSNPPHATMTPPPLPFLPSPLPLHTRHACRAESHGRRLEGRRARRPPRRGARTPASRSRTDRPAGAS